MNLFRRAPQPEPELLAPVPESQPTPILDAEAEESLAAARVRVTSALCAQLDRERQTWEERRTVAYVNFCETLEHHRIAKEKLNGKTGIN
jgi:inorganic triphosphatase YgiF